MSDRNFQIDEAIMSQAGIRWLKVNMIIARVETVLEGKVPRLHPNSTPDDVRAYDELLDAIASRIRFLVDHGRLEGVGNLSNWRHSEVRLPPHAMT